jgi:hypothetical protein
MIYWCAFLLVCSILLSSSLLKAVANAGLNKPEYKSNVAILGVVPVPQLQQISDLFFQICRLSISSGGPNKGTCESLMLYNYNANSQETR